MGHAVTSPRLLSLPLAFTQQGLLSPSEFVDAAKTRGVRLRVEQLVELHHRRALVPLYEIRSQRVRNSELLDVAPSAADGYRQYRSNLALVIDAARNQRLTDPAERRFRAWSEGIALPVGVDRMARYPSVFYSQYQLVALPAVAGLARHMRARQDPDGGLAFELPPLKPEVVDALDGCRQLAILLSALDMHYMPRILLTAHYADRWQEHDADFQLADRLAMFSPLAEATIAAAADQLLFKAHTVDPLGAWYELVRQAHPDTWATFKGDARLAMDYRIAAEILLRVLDDMGRRDLSTPPPPTGRMMWAVLDDRLTADPAELEGALTDRGLSPHPALLLVLEGKTEMSLMPKVLSELYQGQVPSTLIECVEMGSIDRDLDLLVRHVLGPRFGRTIGDAVELSRPPTRILVAVDPEKGYKTADMREKKRRTLVSRLHETLPPEHRTTESRAEIDTLVQVTTWGAVWEFANFTDSELTTAIMDAVTLPPAVTSAEVAARVAEQRHSSHPNVELVTATWGQKVSKVALAEVLTPRLLAKIRRGRWTAKYPHLPAGRIAVQALRTALSAQRRHVAMRVK